MPRGRPAWEHSIAPEDQLHTRSRFPAFLEISEQAENRRLLYESRCMDAVVMDPISRSWSRNKIVFAQSQDFDIPPLHIFEHRKQRGERGGGVP